MRKIRAFFGSVARLGDAVGLAKRVPYLRGGFSDLDWLVGPEATKKAGRTSIFARQLQHEGVGPVDPARGGRAAASEENEATPFTSMHLEQRSLLGHIELAAAFAVRPTPIVHELLIGVSAGHAMTEAQMVADLDRNGRSSEDFGGFRAAVGMVRLPEQLYFANRGGARVRWNVDVNLGGFEGDSYRLFFLSLGMNDSETLAVFPYADNVGYLKISGSFL